MTDRKTDTIVTAGSETLLPVVEALDRALRHAVPDHNERIGVATGLLLGQLLDLPPREAESRILIIRGALMEGLDQAERDAP